MELLCLGLNHRTAPVEVRERFAVGMPKLGEAANDLITLAEAAEGVVISTCNRTEFYLAAESAQSAFDLIEVRLAKKIQVDSSVAAHFFDLRKQNRLAIFAGS